MTSARRVSASLIVALCLAACSNGSRGGETSAMPDPQIGPGVYGDVAEQAGSGDRHGFEIRLIAGSDSATVDIADCRGDCLVQTLPVRRGRGGLSVDYARPDMPGRQVVALSPDRGAVELTADFGDGLKSHRLSRLPAPDALHLSAPLVPAAPISRRP